jgi:hypothetical protein
MQPDLSEFEAHIEAKGPACWATRLDDGQREKVVQARRAGHTYTVISKVVSEWVGRRVDQQAVSHHVRGECQCGR